ncbi:MAG TPA: glycerophosphodiester phosphodiesterase family protein [Magnetospirillum sp.]|nr:glycerophosphodiester phosphodiesterase family protein [Magnetospirillum sp.]
MLSLPRVIGHRGACAHAPENTLASFAKAAELGCAMVEFDVRLTADGVPVVFHDDTVDRCTNGRGRVGGMTLDQLKRLDAGAGETVPTLAEVLGLCRQRGMAVNIEIKPDRGTGAATAQAALAVARAGWDGPPPLISSFDAQALAAAREVMPAWPRSLLVERVPARWPQLIRHFECVALAAHHRTLPAGLVAEITRAGVAVLAYTVNRPGRARRLWGRGVATVFCDAPDRLL